MDKEYPVYNRECPICAVEDDDMFIASCNHRIHLSCSDHLKSLNCPICRKEIANFPKYVNEKIKENEKNYKATIEEEDFQNIRQQEEIDVMLGIISQIFDDNRYQEFDSDLLPTGLDIERFELFPSTYDYHSEINSLTPEELYRIFNNISSDENE